MYPVITENENVVCTERYFVMSDGVGLYTRIVAPKGKEKYPIVFIRTPYEKAHNGETHDLSGYAEDLYIRNGYAVVLQHVRGRGDSEGVCVPYEERADGLESLALIRKLDIYDGEIYLSGGSYLSTAHLCYLDTNPADIKGAVLNIQTDRMYFRNYRNGCCYGFCNLSWWLSMINREHPNPNLEGAIKRPYLGIMERALGTDYPPYTDMLRNDTYNDFWQKDSRTNVIDKLQIPTLFVEGWYDFYIEGMFSMWERLPKATKEKSAFIVGPYGHGTSVSKEAEYPLKNGDIPNDFVVAWFNSLRNKTAYPYAETGKVNYYSIGKDAWKQGYYPRENEKVERFYLGENGTLRPSACNENSAITYLYDPQKRVGCYPYHNIYRAKTKGETEGVLSFETEKFTEEATYFGKIRWHMTVSSDCEDTAFFIRVYFVEDEIAYNLTETITSLSHICENYKVGEKVTIDLYTPPIAFAVKPGGRIRVDISSDGGVYVPHANVKGHWAEVAQTKVAENAVYLQDSYIELCIE